jgi:hypothetical protein
MSEEAELRWPGYVDWPLFPFEGDLRLKSPMVRDSDPPRAGESGGSECSGCTDADDAFVWVDEHWRVRAQDPPSSVPALVFLETREHVDLDGLSDGLAGELGQMIVRLDRAIQAIGDIGRVHAYRWGDGGAHFHMWFYGRPVGLISMCGFGMPFWEPIMPQTPDDIWEHNLAIVARELAKNGGRAIA